MSNVITLVVNSTFMLKMIYSMLYMKDILQGNAKYAFKLCQINKMYMQF